MFYPSKFQAFFHFIDPYMSGYQLQDSFPFLIRCLIFVIFINNCCCMSCNFPCKWVVLFNILFTGKKGFERESHVMPELLYASSHDKEGKFLGHSLLIVSFAFKNVLFSYCNLSICSLDS